MKGRLLGLGILAGFELIAGIGLRNEALAAGARAEASFRRARIVEARLREQSLGIAGLVAPAAVLRRLEIRAALAARRGLEL